MLCSDLARLGTVLVSGLAVGIDATAHSCAVEHGTPTIGVLACGQLVNYPAENEELKRRIVDGGGAVISELLPHAGVEGRYFHQRNRMISGLGLGTLVVEASTRSGCLITANHAIEQGRDLFCVPPGDITRESCAGVVQFLRDGAIPVFDYLDIVNEYMYHFLSKIHAELNEVQSKLLKLIEESPLLVDELVDKTGLPYAQTVEALTELEILGHIQLEPNGKYSLT